jgi:hypothetical protein
MLFWQRLSQTQFGQTAMSRHKQQPVSYSSLSSNSGVNTDHHVRSKMRSRRNACKCRQKVYFQTMGKGRLELECTWGLRESQNTYVNNFQKSPECKNSNNDNNNNREIKICR